MNKKLESLLNRSRGKLRSPVYVWFRERLDTLKPRFKTDPPDWGALGRLVFEEEGVTDRRGNSPSAETMRKTFARVCQDTAPDTQRSQLPRKPRKVRAVLAKDELAPGVRLVTPLPALKPPVALDDLPPLSTDRPAMPKPKFRNPT